MSSRTAPTRTVATSVVFYTVLLSSLMRSGGVKGEFKVSNNLVSGFHGLGTSVAALAALNYAGWGSSLSDSSDSASPDRSDENGKQQKRTLLDDSRNPIIAGKSQLGNALTAWETGYLIYDTGAIMYQSYLKSRSKGLSSATYAMITNSPVFVVHHLFLISGLGVLQSYIARGREKGVWVIVAFLLMNASSPLLHIRWWLRRTRGRASKQIDTLLAATFAGLRFGVVAWVMQKYGAYHGLNGWEAFRSLRISCQSGTAVITTVNAVWWALLVAQMAKRSSTQVKNS